MLYLTFEIKFYKKFMKILIVCFQCKDGSQLINRKVCHPFQPKFDESNTEINSDKKRGFNEITTKRFWPFILALLPIPYIKFATLLLYLLYLLALILCLLFYLINKKPNNSPLHPQTIVTPISRALY